MMKLTEFDPAKYLTTDEAIAIYVGDAFDNEDARGVSEALRDVVRARGGVAQLALSTGLALETIELAVAPTGAPNLDAIIAVSHRLGVKVGTSLVA